MFLNKQMRSGIYFLSFRMVQIDYTNTDGIKRKCGVYYMIIPLLDRYIQLDICLTLYFQMF